jgi:hypothetical protein
MTKAAMQSIVAWEYGKKDLVPSEISDMAYAIADAMIEAREKVLK